MGSMAEAMINGECCAICGVHLEPDEIVYGQGDGIESKMPSDGGRAGVPVVCEDCALI